MFDVPLECGAPASLWYRDGVRASLSCAANHTKAVQAPHFKDISDIRSQSTKYKAQSTKYQAYAC